MAAFDGAGVGDVRVPVQRKGSSKDQGLILVVDDHELLSFSLCSALRHQGLRARTVAPQSHSQVLADAIELSPTLVLLDLHLGDIGHCLPLVRPLTDAGAKVLIVTGSNDPVTAAACLEAGAVGIALKDRPFDELLRATCTALEGGDVLTERERLDYLTTLWEYRGRQTALMEPFTRLTAREEEVLHRLCTGDSVQTIAGTSYVSVPTVRTQVRAILQKLGVGSQLEAVTRAYRSGWHVMQEAYRAG